jgi:hypothetical protein
MFFAEAALARRAAYHSAALWPGAKPLPLADPCPIAIPAPIYGADLRHSLDTDPPWPSSPFSLI